jgi:hypothetical protein
MTISESKIKQIIREETKRALREANIKGGSFAVKPGYKLPADLKSGDRVPAYMLDDPSMSPEEGPGARAAMRMREPRIRSVGNPDYLASLRFDDEDSEGAGEGELPYDSDNPPAFMNTTSADRRDDPDMGSGGGDEDSEGDVDPDELSHDPFYSGGYRVREQRSLNFRSIVKEETLKFLRSRR